MMELLEYLNTLMSTSHLGDIHGSLLQKLFFFDNLFCAVVCCVFLLGFTADIIIKLRIRRFRGHLSQKGDYCDLDPDRA